MRDAFLERDLNEDALLSMVTHAAVDQRSGRPLLRPYLDIARVTLGDAGTSAEPARWALVDGLSCAMTVGVVLELATLESALEVQRALERVAERYLQAPGVSRPGLVRRPALQLLVMPQEGQQGGRWGEVVHAVEVAARGLEVRVGLQLPDFRVVLVETFVSSQSIQYVHDLPALASVFHLRFLSEAVRAQVTLGPGLDALAERLDRAAERLEAMERTVREVVHSKRPTGFQVGSCLADLRQAPDLFRLLGGFEVPGADLRKGEQVHRGARRLAVPVSLEVQIRHWLKGEPARLGLNSLTLVIGENAAGKTTVAESMAILATGMPRARIQAPDRSDEDRGSLRLDLLHPEGEPRWSSPELLPLFADDADLTSGRIGELALPTVWPNDGGLPVIVAVRRIGMASRTYRASLNELLGLLRSLAEEPGPAALPDLALRDGLRWRLDDWMNQWRTNMRNWLDPEHDDHRDPGELDADPAVQAWRAIEDDLARRYRRYSKRPTVLHVTAGLLTPLADDVMSFLLPFYLQSPPAARWTDIHNLMSQIGQEARAYAEAAKLVDEWLNLVGQAVAGWDSTFDHNVHDLIKLAGQADLLAQLEANLEHLLDHQVAHDPHRPNTAKLVRISMARRLARSLLFGAYPMPMVVLDEPTLGQHEAASARTLARFTRLARTLEGHPWMNPHGVWPEIEALQLSGLRAGDQEGLSAPWSSETLERWPWVSLDVCRSHRPPPLLVLSYGRPALNALATVEGEALNHTVAEQLRKLIPDAWRAPLAATLRNIEQGWAPPEAGSVPPRLPAAMAQGLLRSRLWTESPLAGLSWDRSSANHWWRSAQDAAQYLQIRPLLPALMPELKERAPKEVEEPILKDYRELAQRLIAWLALVELLPAALHDGPLHLRVTGMSILVLRYQGGEAPHEGAARLRRVSPAMLVLPHLSGEVASGQPLAAMAQPSASPPEAPPSTPPPVDLLPSVEATASRWPVVFDQPELSPALLRAALAAWRDTIQPGEALRIGLYTSGVYPWNGGDVHLRLDADLRTPGQIAHRFGPELDALYRVLMEMGTPEVVLHVRASAAVAARAGWVFRQVSRSQVRVMAGARNVPEYPWSVDDPEAIGEDPKIQIDGIEPDDARELHAVILPTPNGRVEMYDSWLKQAEQAALRGRIRQIFVTASTDLNHPGMVARWADLLVSAIQTERSRKKGRRVRLFLSGPTALAFAIGRRLNMLGEVVLMDTTADREGYEDRFTLQT